MNCILLPAPHFAATSATAQISSKAHIEHINRVLGLSVGDSIKIGQLGGRLGSAVIAQMTPSTVFLQEVQLTLTPPPKLDVTVVLALPRPKVLRRLIIDMTALGVRDIILINSYRTQKSYWQSPMLKRLDEFVLEGLQQGVDTIAPSIRLQKRFKPFVEDELPSLMTGRAVVAHPESELSFTQYAQQLADKATDDVSTSLLTTSKALLPSMVFIGAEGGWIDYEVDLLCAKGCQTIHLGPRILRTEAAVNAILGQWVL